MAIILQPLGNSSFMAIPPNLTSVACVATAGLLASQSFNPYSGKSQDFLGTNSSDPLPFETKTSDSDVANWCPWDLQVNTPTSPSDNVYAYPDTNIQRPLFDPCYSACAKYSSDSDCCTGTHGSPQSCQPSSYSKAAKGVCPDAYSYGSYDANQNSHLQSFICIALAKITPFNHLARLIPFFSTAAFDDQTSTFVIPAGAGFQVIFCPGGRSTNIFSASAPLVSELANTGSVGHKSSVEQQNGHDEHRLVERSQGAFVSVGVGEPASLTWWLMGIGLALTAGIFVLL
jgi:Thaumatin family